MSRLALALAYHGAAFHGWQLQPEARTVQGELERALADFYGESVRVWAAGRTDAGVHALGQVAGWRAPRDYPPETVLRALEARLPGDLRLLRCSEVPADFHPRHSARGRRYRYLLREGDALFQRDRAMIVGPGLDWSTVEATAGLFVGRRDFAALGTAPRPGGSTVRRLTAGRLLRKPPFYLVEVAAEAFLYRMVRRIVGCLLAVGRGELDAAGLGELLDGRDRTKAPPPAPAHGLYLQRIDYAEFAYTPDPGPPGLVIPEQERG